MSFILERLNADFAPAGLGVVRQVTEPDSEWGEGLVVFEFAQHQTSANPDEVEAAVAHLASEFQEDVIDQLGSTWPEVDGTPLFALAESGVACWCLGGKPWCAVGMLGGAMEAHGESAHRSV